VLIGTNAFIIDGRDHLTGLLDVPNTQEVIVWSAPMLNPFVHTSVFFKTDIVRSLGGYHEKYRIAQDYDLWTRIIAAGYTTMNLPERLVSYRHLESSLSKVGQIHAFEEAAEISQREEKRAFGRSLDPKERHLFSSLRSGLDVSERKQFWKLYRLLEESLKKQSSEVGADLALFTVSIHLKIAGSSAPHICSIIAEVGMAFTRSPRAVLRWFRKRFI